jgi:hypothetical protein
VPVPVAEPVPEAEADVKPSTTEQQPETSTAEAPPADTVPTETSEVAVPAAVTVAPVPLTMLQKPAAQPRKPQAKGAKGTPTKGKGDNTPRGKAAQGKQKTPLKSPRAAGTPMKSAKVDKPRALNPLDSTQTRKVFFDSVPAQDSKAAKTKSVARKHAGKHAANMDEARLVASIAAFERQLTHFSTLDAHLNSR